MTTETVKKIESILNGTSSKITREVSLRYEYLRIIFLFTADPLVAAKSK